MGTRSHHKPRTPAQWAAHGLGALGIVVVVFGYERLANVIAADRAELIRQDARDARIAAEADLWREKRARAAEFAAQAAARMTALEQSHPAAPHEAEFLEQIAIAAEERAVALKEYRPGAQSDRGQWKELDVGLSLAGRYADVCRFLADLDQGSRTVAVRRLSIIAPSSPGGACSVDLTLALLYGATTTSVGESR